MSLSRELGVPLSALKRQVTESQFREYTAHLAHEPPVGDRLDYWFARLIAVTLNANRGRGQSLVKPADLMPDRWADPSPAGRRKKFMDQLRGLAALHGG